MLIEFAILFVLLAAAALGHEISRQVPDEVPRARRYVTLGADLIFLLAIGFTIWSMPWTNTTIGHSVAIGVPLVLAIVRHFVSISRLYAPVTGVLLALGVFSSMQTIVLVLSLLLNYLIGTLTKNYKTLTRELWLQPAAAIVVYLIFVATQAI